MMKEKPETPPSQVATVPTRRLDFRESFGVMGENHNFLLLAIALALPFGSFTAIGNLVSNLFDPFGYSSSELSFICLQLLLAGVVGAVVIGALMDKTRKYKLAMQLITFTITISTIMVIVVLTFYRENESIFIGWM